MKKLSLMVEGIMCNKCVKKIKDTLLNIEGINDINVSDDFKTVTVLCDKTKINALQISDIIERIEDKAFKIID